MIMMKYYGILQVFIVFHHLSSSLGSTFGNLQKRPSERSERSRPRGEFVEGDLAIAIQVHFRHHCLDRLQKP